jgi:outer membrane protein assembly factor BamB
MKLNEKDISFIKGAGNIAGIFTLIVALLMIFSLLQLKTINPLDNPALLSVKEEFDKDQANVGKAEQVRAMDLMARKAYFSTRRQVETGSYLLLAGVVVFILCQRLIAGTEKLVPVLAQSKPDPLEKKARQRQYLTVSASLITIGAVLASFFLREGLPDISGGKKNENIVARKDAFKPDKTNFPSFRGQDGHGYAGGTGYPVDWDGESGKNIKWKTAIPKKGKSSPVIWDDKIFITGAEQKQAEVYCIDKNTGEILWTASASGVAGEPEELPEMDNDGGMAVPTVAANKKAICAIFANGNLVCLDHKGKQKWAKNLGVPKNTYGFASSLIIYEDNLIVQYESTSRHSIIGIDIDSGKEKWETVRAGFPVWSSPIIAYFGGRPQVVVNGNPDVSAYDAVSGQQLWSVECLTGDVGPSLAVNSTMTYAVTNYDKLAAVKAGTGAAISWQDNTITPDVSSPVATEQFLFLSTADTQIGCYDAVKGDTLWSRYLTDPFYASPMIADERVFFLDRTGTMHIVKAAGQYELIAEPKLGEPADCTPAFSDKNIYIRGRNNLYCISEN